MAICCSVNVKEEIEFCNFLKCHSTPLKRVQHQVLIQLESFWPNRSFICQKLISSGNSRFLTCCENIWPPRSCSYLSTNFSLGLTFVSLIRKDCTRRVTQRDEQSNKTHTTGFEWKRVKCSDVWLYSMLVLAHLCTIWLFGRLCNYYDFLLACCQVDLLVSVSIFLLLF